MRAAIVGLVAVAAGMAAGAVVFKMAGEEKIGGAVKSTVTQLGFSTSGGNALGALDFIDKLAPGSKSNLESAVITTVVVTLLTTAAVAVAIEEIAG